jgi:hypothetical protein
MKDPNTIQRYINDFRRHFSAFVREGMGISCRAFPAEGPGALLEFTVAPGIASGDQILDPRQTVNHALQETPQKAFGTNLSGVVFSGTNLISEGNRIILVKGEDTEASWSDADARANVERILAGSRKGSR